jgi:hypothetical protein
VGEEKVGVPRSSLTSVLLNLPHVLLLEESQAIETGGMRVRKRESARSHSTLCTQAGGPLLNEICLSWGCGSSGRELA